ncbi:FAD-dependent oxidoreductase [Streptomyces broussonetiae]|uniref:FAD-binding protein n=1 Tax=Streptomyces broussonetiae TaxID=2686304 RepID=A0A6I6N767_9ACTN|nr:FAD-binding protein [Streptomyces broussonetiae]QHA07252.1 FAD-binding protein [Streptomyces broussonetiae]
MSVIDRRSLLARTGAVAGGALATTALAQSTATAAPTGYPAGDTIRPDDPRFPLLTTGNNQRFVASPEYVRMIRSTADAERAVREAVTTGKRISVRSGGHCFADLVCNPDVEVVLDLSEMTEVGYDERFRAFTVQPGIRLLNLYETLYKGWGVTIPGGMCYSVGAGGHVAGGGYGLLSRAHGLVVDHLYAVEVVVVDADRTVRTVVATREDDDPNRDLWWAHTGGGGGTFGLVTRYWFRSPDATGTEPSRQLVRPPSTVLVSALSFPWQDLDERRFARLLKNFGAWHEHNSAPDSPGTAISTVFNVCHQAHGTLDMFTQVDAGAPNAERLLDDYLTALTAGTGLTATALTKGSGDLAAMPHLAAPRRMPWLNATKLVGTNNPTITHPGLRGAHKSAYLRRNFTDHHTDVLYRHLTSPQYANPDTMVVLFSFGGRVNAVAQDATANSQRRSVFKMLFQTFWADASGDAAGLGWARGVYEEFLHDAGGAPVPGDQYEGCYINYPDTDLKDPARNRSGVSWQTLYYQDNLARLRRVKHAYDPTGCFHHSLSVTPAA